MRKSRKRGLTLAFTAQHQSQIDARVRNVVDFTVYPVIKSNERLCQALVFSGNKPREENLIKTLRFRPRPTYRLYDSREEVPPLKQVSDTPFVEVFNEERDLEEEEDEYDVI